jgi:hypothetical protein
MALNYGHSCIRSIAVLEEAKSTLVVLASQLEQRDLLDPARVLYERERRPRTG